MSLTSICKATQYLHLQEGDLDSAIKKYKGYLPEDDIMLKFVQIALALHYTHSKVWPLLVHLWLVTYTHARLGCDSCPCTRWSSVIHLRISSSIAHANALLECNSSSHFFVISHAHGSLDCHQSCSWKF